MIIYINTHHKVSKSNNVKLFYSNTIKFPVSNIPVHGTSISVVGNLEHDHKQRLVTYYIFTFWKICNRPSLSVISVLHIAIKKATSMH